MNQDPQQISHSDVNNDHQNGLDDAVSLGNPVADILHNVMVYILRALWYAEDVYTWDIDEWEKDEIDFYKEEDAIKGCNYMVVSYVKSLNSNTFQKYPDMFWVNLMAMYETEEYEDLIFLYEKVKNRIINIIKLENGLTQVNEPISYEGWDPNVHNFFSIKLFALSYAGRSIECQLDNYANHETKVDTSKEYGSLKNVLKASLPALFHQFNAKYPDAYFGFMDAKENFIPAWEIWQETNMEVQKNQKGMFTIQAVFTAIENKLESGIYPRIEHNLSKEMFVNFYSDFLKNSDSINRQVAAGLDAKKNAFFRKVFLRSNGGDTNEKLKQLSEWGKSVWTVRKR